MITEVRIRSRKDMKQESYKINEDCIIISISDIDKERNLFAVNSCIRDVCYMWFEDDDTEIPEAISDDQAERIADFVRKYAEKKTPFVCYVNCEAGMSRSAGVGAAIAYYYLHDDDWIFKTKVPNRRCYHKVLNALSGSGAYEWPDV